MPPNLQLATMRDCPFVRRCAQLAYALYVDRIGRKPAPMVADFETAIAQGQVDIVKLDAERVGYAITFIKGDVLFVENIALLPDFQGKGMARHLFNALEARARRTGVSALELYTNEKMVENIALYPRLGFTETGRRTENGFNRVFFRKNLDLVRFTGKFKSIR